MAENDILDNIADAVNASVTGETTDTSIGMDDLALSIASDVDRTLHKGTEDWGKDLYTFENKSDYYNECSADMGVEIDGFLFFPNEVKGDNSFSHREYNRTKIMSGGEFVTRGQYQPRRFTFSTTLTLDPNEPYMYDKVFTIMENKPCEIISPFMGDNFKAEVTIEKTHPTASPSSLNLDITVNEIVDPKTTLVGDTPLEYPSTTYLSNTAVSVKGIGEKESKSKAEGEREQITYDLKAKDDSGKTFENPYD